jgi:hypothetical protein
MRISLQPKVMKIAVEGKRGAKVIFWRFKGWMIHFLFVDICDNFRVLPTGKMSNDPIRYRKSKKQKCGSVGCFENKKKVFMVNSGYFYCKKSTEIKEIFQC